MSYELQTESRMFINLGDGGPFLINDLFNSSTYPPTTRTTFS